MKLSSETFVQGFAKTSVWLNDWYEAFFYFITDRSKVVILLAQQGPFFGHNIMQSRTIEVFYRTISSPNPPQFQFISRTLSKTTVVFGFYVSDSVIVFFSVIWNGAKHRMFKVRGFHSKTNMGPLSLFITSSKRTSLFSFITLHYAWLNLRFHHSRLTMDLNFLLTLIQAESSSPARKNLRKSCNWFASAAIIFPANKKHMVLKCARDPMFLEEADEAIWRIEVH